MNDLIQYFKSVTQLPLENLLMRVIRDICHWILWKTIIVLWKNEEHGFFNNNIQENISGLILNFDETYMAWMHKMNGNSWILNLTDVLSTIANKKHSIPFQYSWPCHLYYQFTFTLCFRIVSSPMTFPPQHSSNAMEISSFNSIQLSWETKRCLINCFCIWCLPAVSVGDDYFRKNATAR